LRVDPRGGSLGRPALYDFDQLRLVALATDVDDRGGPVLLVALAASDEQGLIEPQCLDACGPRSICCEQGIAIGADRIHDRVPVTVELTGDFCDRTTRPPHLRGRPACGSIRHPRSHGCDRVVENGPRALRARDVRAAPPLLVPDEPCRSAERGKIDELDRRTVLELPTSTTARAPALVTTRLHVHHERATLCALHDTEHAHLTQSDKQLAHARRVRFHRGPPASTAFATIDSVGPLHRARGCSGRHGTPLKSEDPPMGRHGAYEAAIKT